MCTREDEIANEIREEFCRRVIPSHIIRYLTCITIQDTEMVRAVEKQNGPLSAAEILLERLVVRPNWLHDLKRVLLIQDVGLLDFGENLEEKCRQSSVTVGAIEECIDGHGCREKEEQTPPTDEVKMCTREEEIANEKKDEFSNQVLLSSIITYQRCLTIQYTEMVQAVEKRDGPIYADALLLEVFVRPLDRLNDLKVVLIQDIGLLDFGEKLEEKCRQSSVTFGAIEEYIDGHGCGEKEEKTPPTDEENVKTAEKQLGPINADVGLLDFGEKLEEKCRQSNVMKSLSTDKENVKTAEKQLGPINADVGLLDFGEKIEEKCRM